MSTSRAVLLRDMVREYGLGKSGTATSATTTTVVDLATFGGFQAGGQFPNGSAVGITGGAAAGGRSYKQSIEPSTGTLTFSGTITGNTGTPTYVITDQVDSIDRLCEALDRTLTQDLTRRMKVPLTDIPDGDFNGAAILAASGGAWTVVGASATIAYALATMADGPARRVGQLTTAGAAGYMLSTAIAVEPGETRRFFCLVKNTSDTNDTAYLECRNTTAGTQITNITVEYGPATLQTTTDSFIRMSGTYVVPAGCGLVQWRLGNTATASVSQFADMIDVGVNQRVFPAQPHLLTLADVGEWYTIRQHDKLDSTARPQGFEFVPTTMNGVSFDSLGWGINFDFQDPPIFPAFYDETAFYPALASDTDTTDAIPEILLLGAYRQLCQQQSDGARTEKEAARWATRLADAERRWKQMKNQRLQAPRQVRIRRSYVNVTSA